MSKEIIQKLSQKHEKYVRICYRHLHANPELSFQEFETSSFVQNELSKMNIPFETGIGGTGILGRINGKNSGKVIALRADMDALPICEATNLLWKSKNNNIMHACGHDAHTACLLGVAAILNELKSEFDGTVLLIFQPGEEKSPGGASLMLKDGIFDKLKPDLILGQHVSLDYPTGTLAFAPGRIMASADEIHLKVKGKGGHGALPHTLNDTVLAASQIIVSLQQVKSRLCHPLTPMVLTFGRFISNGATNVIPNEVELSGTFRTLDENWRIKAKKHIQRIINETAAAYGCTVDIDMPDGYPCVDNDKEVTDKAIDFAKDLLGKESTKKLEVRMTAEDFGFFTQKYPCCFYRFGVKGKSNINSGGLHSPTFQIDEDALYYGISGLAWLALRFLNK